MSMIDKLSSLSGMMSPGRSFSAAMSPDGFMKLLLAQLKMQSPTNPFDSNTMMQQMSQLTTLSATQDLQKAVKNLNESTETSQVLEAAKLVGKKIQVPASVSPLTNGEGLDASVILPQDVDKVVISIRDSNDKLIKTIEMGASPSGVLDFHWDGLDTANQAMADGFYRISATATVGEQSREVPTAGTFIVNSVALDRRGNGVILNVDGLGGVSMQEVLKIL